MTGMTASSASPTAVPGPTHPDAFRLRRRAENLASALPPMLVAAERIANALIHGLHGRRRSGPGEDFWQYRSYSFGDSVQSIDWRKSSRSDRVLVRENEWAASHTVWLWASQGAGMDFRSHLAETTKRDRAVLLALALSVLATKAGERVGAIGSPHRPGHTSATLNRMAEWYVAEAASGGPPLPPKTPLPRYSAAVLIGDFLEPLDEIASHFSTLASNEVTGHVVQVLDPAEETLPYHGRTEFLEIVGARRLMAGRAETLRERYQARLKAQRDGLRDLAQRLGWSFTVHSTGRPPHQVLLALFGLLVARQSPAGRVTGA
jgi:uncharacterized protein (DUF58 family)